VTKVAIAIVSLDVIDADAALATYRAGAAKHVIIR
jgi:hypothetical protein